MPIVNICPYCHNTLTEREYKDLNHEGFGTFRFCYHCHCGIRKEKQLTIKREEVCKADCQGYCNFSCKFCKYADEEKFKSLVGEVLKIDF